MRKAIEKQLKIRQVDICNIQNKDEAAPGVILDLKTMRLLLLLIMLEKILLGGFDFLQFMGIHLKRFPIEEIKYAPDETQEKA